MNTRSVTQLLLDTGCSSDSMTKRTTVLKHLKITQVQQQVKRGRATGRPKMAADAADVPRFCPPVRQFNIGSGKNNEEGKKWKRVKKLDEFQPQLQDTC